MFNKNILVVLLLIAFTNADDSCEPVVSTSLGKIKGSTELKTRLGKTIYSFRGIHYGQPPTGQLRFKPPVPVEAWGDKELDASKEGPACPQPVIVNYTTSEDCLCLNVYTRNIPKKQPNMLQPVMMFLHPGGFYGWSGISYFIGPEYLLDEKIVLVAINYRLGTLGFLSTGDEYAPGNYGMKDQVLAMKWVQQHIRNFGGDPNQVTLFGYSAGAVSISLHLVSPAARGLFNKAVCMSTSVIKNSPTPNNQMDIAKKQARFVGCPDNSSKAIVDCLRTKPAQEIASTFNKFPELSGDPVLIWRPVVEPTTSDQPYLTEDPVKLLSEGRFQKVPLMTGITQNEFKYFAYRITRNETLKEIWNNNFTYAAPIAFQYERDTERSKNISQQLRDFYLGDQRIDNDTVPELGDIYADSINGLPVHRLVRLVTAKNTAPVFYYKFSYKGRYSFFYIPGTDQETIGPVHHDDLLYLILMKRYGFPLFTLDDPEIETVRRMIKLYTNFAKYGNPTPNADPILDNVIWEPYTLEGKQYLEINDTLSIGTNFFADRYALFDKLFPLDSLIL